MHSLVVVERLRLRHLRWGNKGDCISLLQQLGQCDVVLGADVAYVESAVSTAFCKCCAAAEAVRQGGHLH